MKKVCFITTTAGTIKGFILSFAKYMYENAECDITFICDPNESFEKELPEYIHYIPVNMKRGISIGGLKSCIEMKKIFKENRFDMIQYSTPNASLYAAVAGTMAKIPVRLYCQWGLVYVGFEGIKRKIFKLEEKLVCHLSTWIEPDSMGNLEFCHAEKLYPINKGSVVNKGSASGVSLEKFNISKKQQYRREIRKKWDIPEETFVYGFVGRITGDKGINELLQASREILDSFRDVRVMLIGEIEKEATLNQKLLEWSKKENRIIYCGSTSEIEKYMAAMDCYVMPSYREGFGLTVVEAGAMGVPVICSNIPGPTDAIVDGATGILVKKKDVKELKEAVIRLYQNSDLREQLGEAGLKNVRKNYEQKKLFEYILEDRMSLLKK